MELLEEFYQYCAGPEAKDGPYTSIVHCDLWINNIMLKYGKKYILFIFLNVKYIFLFLFVDHKGQPENVKFVDFQISQYENVVHDLIFFLFSSCSREVLDQHLDDLLYFYYKEFLKCLESIDNQYGKNYSFIR